MARVTVEDCIRYYPNRFEMVLLASRRARQLLNGMPPMLDGDGDKPAVQALREMGEGFVSWDVLFEQDEQERRRVAAVAAEEEVAEGAA
ncbi:MAG: DNA-directed RNA polymerase subunit omega [Mariprofundus sp.]|nr:DNA-directed RNA polymerase subunit omega [Mariprofundus sp.]